MTFYCLCMSPALDALVRLPSAPKGEGEIYKNVIDEENAGGKTINVARWLAIRGATVFCGGLLGEDNAAPFEKELKKFGLGDRFVRVAGSTRRNEMITWPDGAIKVNRAAFPNVRPEDFPGLSALRGLDELSAGDVVILSGSLPQNFPPSFYADCVKLLKERGFTVVLDASGKALELGVKAHPDLIKPNAEECEPLVGFVPKTADEFRRATEILRADCAHVVISDGGAGAWFDGVFQAAPKVDVVDTTAAGDTLLAEWVWRWVGEVERVEGVGKVERVEGVGKVERVEGVGKVEGVERLKECARWAVAAGSAACAMPGSLAPPVEMVERLKGTI